MDSFLQSIYGVVSSFGPFFLLLGLLVFIHELGHFLVAKWCGVKVEVFSLGFGKKLLQYKYGDTVYCISVVPLGGYVKMYGESLHAEVSEDEKNKSFIHKPVGQRIAIVLAGPLMNLFFAFFLFVAIGVIGDKQLASTLGDLDPQSQAYQAGFRDGDTIVQVNGESILGWTELTEKVSSSAEQNISFTVQRNDETLQIDATPKLGPNDNIFSRSDNVGVIEGLTFEAKSTLIGIPDTDSVAYKAGLRSLDLITHINNEEVLTYRDLENALSQTTGEETVELKVQSLLNGERSEVRTVNVLGGLNSQQLGMEFAENYVLKTKPGSPADTAGLKSGDKIIAVNDMASTKWEDILSAIKNFDPEKQQNIVVTARRDSQDIRFEIEPEMTQLMTQKGQEENRFTIGIISSNYTVGPKTVFYKPSGVLNTLAYGGQQTWQWTEFTVMSIVRLFQGMVSPKNIGGVITIGRVANHSYDAGISVFLKTMAIISINLFLLNLLPVPVLDGGHLVFFGLEAIKGSPVSLRKLEVAQQVGLMLLFLLMAFALFNDVSNLFFNRW